jgi:NTE family protein
VSPAYPVVHLWDGGVYDNHGLEGLHDFITGWPPGVDFLIVSDGAGRSQPEAYRPGMRALLRIITGIMMDQIRSLRARAILERLINHPDRGAFLQTGNTTRYVLEAAGKGDEVAALAADCLSDDEAQSAAEMPTTIRRLTPAVYERLFRHGFEVADCTLYGYNDDLFGYVGYGNRAGS